jgi:acetyl-CoA acyltransferase 1
VLIDVVSVAGAGVESMTNGFGSRAAPDITDTILESQEADDCLIPMGMTSKNVTKGFNISRQIQDEFAAKSSQKAAAGQRVVRFKDKIGPIKAMVDPKTEKEVEIVVDADDSIRDGVAAASLSKLKQSFSKDGSIHAGNASQVSDCAATVLLARRSVAKKLGLHNVGKFVKSAVVGAPPASWMFGPAFAIPKILDLVGLIKDEVDFYGINEAFPSQAVFSIRYLKIPVEKANIRCRFLFFIFE